MRLLPLSGVVVHKILLLTVEANYSMIQACNEIVDSYNMRAKRQLDADYSSARVACIVSVCVCMYAPYMSCTVLSVCHTACTDSECAN
jgi:hypothetical protein